MTYLFVVQYSHDMHNADNARSKFKYCRETKSLKIMQQTTSSLHAEDKTNMRRDKKSNKERVHTEFHCEYSSEITLKVGSRMTKYQVSRVQLVVLVKSK